MLTVKWQSLSGEWYQDTYPSKVGHVMFKWKAAVGVSLRVELWQDGVMVIAWSKK